MVSEQVTCTLDEALLLMRGRAQSSDTSLDYVALSVVKRDLRFD